MDKSLIYKPDPPPNSEHPAFIAWKKLRLSRVEPQWIELMKNRHGRARVYRLHGIGPDASPVIAKSCGKETGLREQTIYEQILRHLPVPTPRFYGSVVEHNCNHCWIFIEDIGGEKYSLKNAGHRRLAASWVGLLHTSAERFAETVYLPDRDPEHYKNQIQIARNTIMRHMDNVALRKNDKMILQRILSHLDEITTFWNKIEDFCKDMPRTLIHGDLVTKNVQVRHTHNEFTLVPFDWGTTAGWGPPAVDLAQFVGRTISPDLDIYHSIVSQNWPHLKPCDINHLAEMGKIFRLINSIKWESESLAYEWVEKPMRNMRIYKKDLRDTIQAEGWKY